MPKCHNVKLVLIIEFGPCPSLGPRIVLFTKPRDYDDYDDYDDGQARKQHNYNKWSGAQKIINRTINSNYKPDCKL